VTSRADRCSLRSEASGEQLAGTASTIRNWLLIEHPGPWGRDGLLDARLPAGFGRALRDLETRTRSRVLLIRSRRRGARVRDIACFAVDTAGAWLGATELRGLQEALDLDPRERSGFRDADGPLVVVCTHGRRDPCCAERGRPLEQATSTVFPGITWESTHVGGDRFAGNLVAFPHGLYFGRVGAREGPEVVSAYTQGRIGSLDRYRGRSSDPFHVQAADIAIRRELGVDGIDDIHLEGTTKHHHRAVVAFSTPVGRRVVHLLRTDATPMRLTCHSEREESPTIWRPIDIEA
jgi:hypothetical protein